MAEYFPCPWCGADVTATPPKKTAATVAGAVSTGSSPSILWDRRGGKHTETGCDPATPLKT